MIATALDRIAMPPVATLLGWHLLDARPGEGWIRIGFEGKTEFCNPAGFVQGGILSAMLDDTMGPAVFAMTEGRLYTATISLTVNFLAPAKTRADRRRGAGDTARQDRRVHRRPVIGEGRYAARDRDDQCAAGRSRQGVAVDHALARLASGNCTIGGLALRPSTWKPATRL